MQAIGRAALTGSSALIPKPGQLVRYIRDTCPSACMKSCRNVASTSPFCATLSSASSLITAWRCAKISCHRITGSIPPVQIGTWQLCPRWVVPLIMGQTRILAGASLRLPFGACTKEHLQAAKHNLDAHFQFVGLTERFDLSLALMRRLCGWKWHFYVPDNVASPDFISIDPCIIEQIRALNHLDLELYRYVQQRFEVLVDQYGWRLRAENLLFRWGNVAHQRLHVLRQARKARKQGRERPAMRPLRITASRGEGKEDNWRKLSGSAPAV